MSDTIAIPSGADTGHANNSDMYRGMAPRLRLTRRGRVVFTVLASTPLVIVALAFALNGGMATATVNSGLQASPAEYVTVSGGQSLWQLAEAIAPADDTREVIAQILQANALDSANVYAGQQLVIPNQYR